MPSFPKVNPQIDGNVGSFFGKYPDYLEINFGATSNITSSQNLGPNGAWPIVIQQVEQLATIEVLGKLTANCVLLSQNGGNANVGVRMLVTGPNAANATALQAAIQSLGTVVTGNATAGFSNVNLAAVTVAALTIYGDATGPNSGGQTATWTF